MKQFTDKQFNCFTLLCGLIWDEHENQLEKWGVQKHTLFGWNTILMEEVGELSQAMLKVEYGIEDKVKIVAEAIQVATLALKIAEMTYENNNT